MKKVSVKILANIEEDKFLPLRQAIASDKEAGVSASVCIGTGAIYIEFKDRGAVYFKIEDLAKAAADCLEAQSIAGKESEPIKIKIA